LNYNSIAQNTQIVSVSIHIYYASSGLLVNGPQTSDPTVADQCWCRI